MEEEEIYLCPPWEITSTSQTSSSFSFKDLKENSYYLIKIKKQLQMRTQKLDKLATVYVEEGEYIVGKFVELPEGFYFMAIYEMNEGDLKANSKNMEVIETSVDYLYEYGNDLLYEGCSPSKYVVNLQRALGFSEADAVGYFGPQTAAAVRQFQNDCNITVDGIVGEDTKYYLISNFQ